MRAASLVAVVVSKKDAVDGGDAFLLQSFGNAAVTAVDKQGFCALSNDAHMDRAVVDPEMIAESGQVATGSRGFARPT